MKLSEIGVLVAKEKQFNKKGIFTVEDLISYFPRKYNDYSVVTGLLPEENESTLILTVDDVKMYNAKMPVLIARCRDIFTNDKVVVSWFHQNYLFAKLNRLIGQKIFVVGKASYNAKYRNYEISGPSFFSTETESSQRIYPVYSKIAGMSDEYLFNKIQIAMSNDSLLQETCPAELIRQQGLPSMKESLMQIHNPQDMEALKQAQKRIVFDDLLYYAASIEYAERKVSNGTCFNIKTLKTTNAILKSLPFDLTADQKKALKEMVDLAKDGRRINALVQGDVSCGKTIVAFLIMVAMVDSGYQAAIMAPTQVLARQHYEELKKLVEPFGLKVAFFGGQGMKAKEKREVLTQLKTGEIQLAVGTHSLLNKDIEFKQLALVVADEEHKFGVLQRAALLEKASMGVHSVTMSATPIPRSLASVIYGSGMQLHTIKTMPKGRMPVKTGITKSFEKTFEFLYKELNRGRQVYVVCPMIDKNEDMAGVKSVEEVSDIYKKEFEKNGYRILTLTGRNSKEETEKIINDFKKGNAEILISTTVIEVGVNVPNASVMVVQNAERFGLSGLHQLRGRVGRGSQQSYCILFSEDKENERLQTMVETTDGFKIAEADLKQRGAGELIGTRQSGYDKYMGLMLSNPEWYEDIKKIASKLLDEGSSCPLIQRVIKGDETDD